MSFARLPFRRSRASRRPAVFALHVLLGTLLVLTSACSDNKATAEATPTKQTAKPDPASELPLSDTPADLAVAGSIHQALVTDALPGEVVRILDKENVLLDEATVDRLGSVIFRDLAPGGGYRIETVRDESRQQSEAFAVLDESPPAQSFYDKQELKEGLNYITARDGVKLAATVRLPEGKDIGDGPFPTVIEYSGYEVAPPSDLLESMAAGILNPDAPRDKLAPATSTVVGGLFAPLLGFATVSLQLRGSGCSGGDFDLFNLPTIYDGYDAIETVAAEPWVKGNKVGMVGISFSGYSQLYVGGTQPPHLAALAPMSVLGDMYRGIGFPGGIFNNGFALGWMTERGEDAQPAPGEGQPWATELIKQGDTTCLENQKLRLQTENGLDILEHAEYRDPKLFDARTPATWMDKIEVPVFLVGSFQDEQLGSNWANSIEKLDKNNDVWVTMYNGSHNDALGPEVFTRWVEFLKLFVADEVPVIPDRVMGLASTIFAQIGKAAAAPLEQTRMAGQTDVEAARAQFRQDPRVRVLMEVGAGPLGQRSLQSTSELTFDSWPPAEVTPETRYLSASGALSTEAPTADAPSDEYQSDPSTRPFTSLGKNGSVYDADAGYDWQPVAEGNGLGYITEPLAAGQVLMGTASVDLQVAATAENADLQATLTEVRPDGGEVYLSSGWLRLAHRALDTDLSTKLLPVQTHANTDGELLIPVTMVAARIQINPFAAQLRPGSRLRLTIQAPGGDVPLWKFRTIEYGATKVSIGHVAASPSALVLPVLNGGTITTPLPGCDVLRGQPCRTYVPALNGG